MLFGEEDLVKQSVADDWESEATKFAKTPLYLLSNVSVGSHGSCWSYI